MRKEGRGYEKWKNRRKKIPFQQSKIFSTFKEKIME